MHPKIKDVTEQVIDLLSYYKNQLFIEEFNEWPDHKGISINFKTDSTDDESVTRLLILVDNDDQLVVDSWCSRCDESQEGDIYDCLEELVIDFMEEFPNKNKIVCAANRYDDGTVVLGVRHFDEHMRLRLEMEPEKDWKNIGHVQGFIDKNGEFQTREEALKIAKIAYQIYQRVGGDANKLFSENLY